MWEVAPKLELEHRKWVRMDLMTLWAAGSDHARPLGDLQRSTQEGPVPSTVRSEWRKSRPRGEFMPS
jgi:hypothetical protein